MMKMNQVQNMEMKSKMPMFSGLEIPLMIIIIDRISNRTLIMI